MARPVRGCTLIDLDPLWLEMTLTHVANLLYTNLPGVRLWKQDPFGKLMSLQPNYMV